MQCCGRREIYIRGYFGTEVKAHTHTHTHTERESRYFTFCINRKDCVPCKVYGVQCRSNIHVSCFALSGRRWAALIINIWICRSGQTKSGGSIITYKGSRNLPIIHLCLPRNIKQYRNDFVFFIHSPHRPLPRIICILEFIHCIFALLSYIV